MIDSDDAIRSVERSDKMYGEDQNDILLGGSNYDYLSSVSGDD